MGKQPAGARGARARRRTAEQMGAMAAAWRTSGLTQSAFARREGLSLWQVRAAIYRRPVVAEGPHGPGGGLVAVRLSGGADGTVKLRLPDGRELEVSLGVEAAGGFLRELLRSC